MNLCLGAGRHCCGVNKGVFINIYRALIAPCRLYFSADCDLGYMPQGRRDGYGSARPRQRSRQRWQVALGEESMAVVQRAFNSLQQPNLSTPKPFAKPPNGRIVRDTWILLQPLELVKLLVLRQRLR